jgi:hypothetical protein
MRYFLLLLPLLGVPPVPQQGDPISVHVREVHRDEDTPTAEGTWYHVKAVVESKTVVYTLSCDEFLNMKIREYTLRCL